MRILLVAALLLSAFIYLRPRPGYDLSDVPPEKANAIRIEKEGMAEIVLAKGRKGWEIEKPVRERANQGAVRNLLSLLEAKSDRKLDAGEISRFGLDKPTLRIHIDREEFDFGMLNPVTGQQYVRNGDWVYLISARYALVPSLLELEADHAGAS
ncbi:MAG TPA: DUF4340 domain-containing protein [Burkholderiales bacterium]|nr:DUF4340 domain-containing protein [Burkholderiales bacterium]